ncbi:MAG TPA: hypothetical protein VF511_05845 [Chthoniobacterales bacterium]
MKILICNRVTTRGYTLAEMSVAVGVLGLLGLVFFSVLNSGLVLAAKNTAVNAAHQEARDGILRLTRDIHASISVPQLRDANLAVVNSKPTNGVAPFAAGVSFQNVFSGPNYVWKDPTNPSLIMIKDNPDKPTPGMRIIVPFWGLEEDITKVVANGNHHNVFINADESTPNIGPPSIGGSSYAILYYTQRVMYVVKNGSYVRDSQGDWILSGGNYVSCRNYTASTTGAYVLSAGVYVPYTGGTMQRYNMTITAGQRYRYENGELHLYKQIYSAGTSSWSDVATVAKYLSSPTPFYVPLNSGGSPDTKYIGVNLSARDPKSSNRGYLASASLLNTQIDYRSRITLTQ